MSQRTEEKLECPKCGTVSRVELWRSLNVSLDPCARQSLLDGTLNLFKCAKCGIEGHVPIPLLYHDMENQFCVQYYPFEWLEDDSFRVQFSPDGQMRFPGLEGFAKVEGMTIPDYMSNPHIVLGMDEMARYVTFRGLISTNAGIGAHGRY